MVPNQPHSSSKLLERELQSLNSSWITPACPDSCYTIQEVGSEGFVTVFNVTGNSYNKEPDILRQLEASSHPSLHTLSWKGKKFVFFYFPNTLFFFYCEAWKNFWMAHDPVKLSWDLLKCVFLMVSGLEDCGFCVCLLPTQPRHPAITRGLQTHQGVSVLDHCWHRNSQHCLSKWHLSTAGSLSWDLPSLLQHGK